MASIKLDITRSSAGAMPYTAWRVDITAKDGDDIANEIFAFLRAPSRDVEYDGSRDVFSGIAGINDIDIMPIDPALTTPESPYYRSSILGLSFPTEAQREEAIRIITEEVGVLVATKTAFDLAGSETETVTIP